MSPRPESAIEFLRGLAGRLGRGSAVDEKAHETLELCAGTLRQVADAIDTQARRVHGEAAQHSDDEERLSSLVQPFEPRAEPVHEGHVLEKSDSRAKPLTPPERDRVERFLEKHPNAGRPAISAHAGITDWQARRYLAERKSQAGEVAGEARQLAGEISSPRARPSPRSSSPATKEVR